MIGQPVDLTNQQLISKRIRQLLGTNLETFPGAEPNRLTKHHLHHLLERDYLVTSCGTGQRALLFLCLGEQGPLTFMLCDNTISFIPDVHFPTNQQQFHNDTLLDGEFVQRDKRIVYCSFDLLAINGTSMVQRSFSTRLGILQQDVILPYSKLKDTLISVEMKRHERSYGFTRILDIETPKSLIFTAIRSAYVPGRDKNHSIFEWRAPNHNTFRFRIHVVRDKDLKLHYQIMVADKSINKYYDSLSLEPEIAQAWRSMNVEGRVADFRYDPEWETLEWEQGYARSTRKGGWRFVRFSDKPVQGEQRKLLASIRSYQEPVTLDMLTELIERMRHEWKQREKRGLDTRRKSSEIRHIRRDSQDMDSTRSDSTSHPSPHVNISPHVQSNAKPDLGYVSPKRQKTEPEEEEEELDNGSSVPIQPMTIENIAEHQPKKLEQNVEIALPPPLTVQTSDKNLDDEDSPLEDLSLERYKRSVVVKTVQSVTPSVTPPVHLPPQPSPSLQSPTLSSSQNPSLQSPTHPSATQRSPNLQSPGQATGTNPPVMQTPEQKKKKKREWLDMILNS